MNTSGPPGRLVAYRLSAVLCVPVKANLIEEASFCKSLVAVAGSVKVILK